MKRRLTINLIVINVLRCLDSRRLGVKRQGIPFLPTNLTVPYLAGKARQHWTSGFEIRTRFQAVFARQHASHLQCKSSKHDPQSAIPTPTHYIARHRIRIRTGTIDLTYTRVVERIPYNNESV